MMTQPGQRAALVAILSEGTSTMPGNIAYLIGEDSANPDAIWIVELWDSKEAHRSEEHTSELQSLMRISYAVFCLKKKNYTPEQDTTRQNIPHTKNISNTDTINMT